MKPLNIADVLQDLDLPMLAVAMEGAALNEALAVEMLAQWQWRDPDRLKAETMASCRQRARAMAEAHALLLALVPHQRALKILLTERRAA